MAARGPRVAVDGAAAYAVQAQPHRAARRQNRVKKASPAVGMASRGLPAATAAGLTEARATDGRTVRSEGSWRQCRGGAPRPGRFVRTDGTHPGMHIEVWARHGAGRCRSVLAFRGGFAPLALVLATAATVVPLAGAFGAAASTVAAVGLGAWLLTVGFLVNQYGILTWNGSSDIYRLGIIAAAGGRGPCGWRAPALGSQCPPGGRTTRVVTRVVDICPGINID